MALPAKLRAEVDKVLQIYCARRVPAEVRDEVRLRYKFRGNSVTIIEERPNWFDQSQWLPLAIAQMRYDHATGEWHLYWPDRNTRWHLHDDIGPAREIEQLLEEIDTDPTGICWG